jgi:hypothetical protein
MNFQNWNDVGRPLYGWKRAFLCCIIIYFVFECKIMYYGVVNINM